MTLAALQVLERDKKGFFLMIEGSQIDWAGHDNDISYLLGEMIGFDESVRTVLEWIEQEPIRKAQTLLIVVADHETGGMMINGPYGTLSMAEQIVDDSWTSDSHTAQDTIIWSQGLGSYLLGKPLQNTDLFRVMKCVMK